MSQVLPFGWLATKLGEIVAPSGRTVRAGASHELSYVGMEHVEPGTMRLLGHIPAGDVRGSSKFFAKGDVLLGKMRPYLNKVWVATFDGLCSTEFLVFPSRSSLDAKFLAYRLNTQDFVDFANSHVSGDRPRVDYSKLAEFPLLLPPLAEQTRIAAKLDEILEQIADGEASVGKARDGVATYRRTVLRSAATGELTQSWRKENPSPVQTGADFLNQVLSSRRQQWHHAHSSARIQKNEARTTRTAYPEPVPPDVETLPTLPKTWTWASADQLVEANRPITYGVIKLGADTDSGIPVLRSSNVRALFLQRDPLKRVAPAISDAYRRTVLKGGEVLVTVRGTLGGVVSVPSNCAGFNISREVAMLAVLLPRRLSRLVAYFIASNLLQEWLNARTKGIAYTGINIETLRALPIPVPPPDEQEVIVRELEQRLETAEKTSEALDQQLTRAKQSRQLLLAQAMSGKLLQQNPADEPASALLARLKEELTTKAGPPPVPASNKSENPMQENVPTPDSLRAAWEKINRKTDAQQLFVAGAYGANQVVAFYEALRATPEIREAFALDSASKRTPSDTRAAPLAPVPPAGMFRLISVWLKDFKNLQDYTVNFDPANALDVVLGWNGTGKSNLFEALVIIFRDMHIWWEKNRWPEKPLHAFALRYRIDNQIVHVTWDPATMRRPTVMSAVAGPSDPPESAFTAVARENLPLPKFVFGYYSGPTNRLAEHFLPMKQDHYVRLREAKADDPATLARLLEQRRFFCAETHHAKYALLAFSHKNDPNISRFLEDRLRIVGFESALFVIRKPRWAKPKTRAETFWGATGIMRRVMERLRRFAIAPMVLPQTVTDGYRTATEDHFFFFLPDLASLHAFAAEYQDARTFFLALESTDFSELIHDVQLQVRVKATKSNEVSITFHQLSEGEQQLLMVLGLMRFTKFHQSLVLLDEPDTHLNPHWSVDYLKDLAKVMSDDAAISSEQQTSQILIATHDPLVIASLLKEQIHLLKRDPKTGNCFWSPATVNPRGMGFTGILTSEMFGFRSDLDPETLADLDNRVRLVAKDGKLSAEEKQELERIDQRLAAAGFSKSFSDPYYAAFVRAWGKRHSALMAGQRFLTPELKEEVDRIALEVLKEAVAEVEAKTGK